MRARFALLILSLALVIGAFGAVTPVYELPDPLANDAAALTYIQANFWDSTSDGTGTAREGQCYYNTTSDLRRCYDGSSWQDIDATSTHVAGNGSDHANVATNTSHGASTANPHATDIGNLGAGTIAELATATSDGDAQPQRGNTLYVDTANGNDGTPAPWGYETITAALAAASSGDVVDVAPGAYTESFSVPAGVILRGPGAALTGNTSPNVTLANGSRVELASLTVPGGQIGVIQATASAYSVAEISTITVGASSFGVINTGANAILVARVHTVYVGAGSFAFGDVTSSAGHIDVTCENVYGTGAAGFALATFGAGQIVGYVGHILDAAGTLTAITAQGTAGVEIISNEVETTTGALVGATAAVKVITTEWDCTTGYNVTAGGELLLWANEFAGTETGTASLGTLAELDAATVHISSDGTDHSYIDQDVSIGSSPTLDGTNITGITTEPFTSLDLSGTYDWSANGSASVDPTSGLIAYWTGSAPTTMEVGSNKISFNVQATIDAFLWIPIPNSLPINRAGHIQVTMRYKITTQTADFDSLTVMVRNNAPSAAEDEAIAYRDYHTTAAGKTQIFILYGGAFTGSATVATTSGHEITATAWVDRVNGNATANMENYSETGGAWIGGQTAALGQRWWPKDGDSDDPVLHIGMTSDAGGNIVGEIYEISVRCY